MNTQLPIVRRTAWLYIIPQLLIMLALMLLAWKVFLPDDFRRASIYGAAGYLLYSFGSKSVLLKNHRRGIYFAKLNSYRDAIHQFQLSYQFLNKHPWVDKYRFVTMLDSSAISYREMALCNMAFSHAQLQENVPALHYYRRTLEQFPECEMAKNGVLHIESGDK